MNKFEPWQMVYIFQKIQNAVILTLLTDSKYLG